METWVPISGYGGYYEVSDFGNVRSVDRVVRRGNTRRQIRGKTMSQYQDADGYQRVKLSKDGKSRSITVHRLVAEAFVPGWFDGAEVDHLDTDRKNNYASNLRWVSHAANIAHTIETGRHVSQKGMAGSNNPNYGNRKLSLRYSIDKEAAKRAQSRPGAQNGRATPIKMIGGDEVVDFPYMAACAEYLISTGVSKSTSRDTVATNIAKAMKASKQYLGYTFVRS